MSLGYNIKKIFEAAADKCGAASQAWQDLGHKSEGFVPFVGLIALSVASFNIVTKEEPVYLKPVTAETVAMIADPAQTVLKEALGHITTITGLQKKLTDAKIGLELLPVTEKPTAEEKAAHEAAKQTIADLNKEINKTARQFELLIYTSPQLSEKQSAQLAKQYTLMTGRKASFFSDNYAITNASFQYKNECIINNVSGDDTSTEDILAEVDRCTRQKQLDWQSQNGYSFGQGLTDVAQAVGLGLAGTAGFNLLTGMGAAAYRRRKQQKPN